MSKTPAIVVEFAGEYYSIATGDAFTIGREGDLIIDENPFLHRNFLEISESDGLWWLTNVGSRLTASVAASDGAVQAWLAPGARLPIVFDVTSVNFSAGPTSYGFDIHTKHAAFRVDQRDDVTGESTIGDVPLTLSQKQLIVALAEPQLMREGSGMSEIPTSANAAKRLGWTTTRFNRKLDNVCDKFDRIGVPGLRGGYRTLATNRRARLVEYALTTRLVTRNDLPLLDVVDDDEAAGGAEA